LGYAWVTPLFRNHRNSATVADLIIAIDYGYVIEAEYHSCAIFSAGERYRCTNLGGSFISRKGRFLEYGEVSRIEIPQSYRYQTWEVLFMGFPG
jgi:hypothetical protein